MKATPKASTEAARGHETFLRQFAAILKKLKAAAYPGYMCLEYVGVDWEGCNRTDDVSETILRRDLLRQTEKLCA